MSRVLNAKMIGLARLACDDGTSEEERVSAALTLAKLIMKKTAGPAPEPPPPPQNSWDDFGVYVDSWSSGVTRVHIHRRPI